MQRGKILGKPWPPGQATILALAVSGIIAIIFESWLILLIGFIILSVLGEIWQYRRTKPLRETGKIKPSHPYAIVGLIFAIISLAFLIVSIWGVMRIEYLFPTDGWIWSVYNGVVWNTLSLSIIALILSGIAILRASKGKKYNRWLPLYSLVIAVLVIWLSMSAVVNVVSSMNGMAMEGYRETKLGLVKMKQKAKTTSLTTPAAVIEDTLSSNRDTSNYR
ncbi:hypothetical protein JXI42_02710 [bacterium]|nr:hypothetical protein [bacterium]